MNYNTYNDSLKKTCIYRIGDCCGFFSEYNTMVWAMLYCLKHRIKFKLFSKYANFSFSKKGWTDYFEPFCTEELNSIQRCINHRPKYTKIEHFWQLKYWIYENIFSFPIKKYYKYNYSTQDLWFDIFRFINEGQDFNIPELSIEGNIQSTCNKLVNITWKYNEKTKKIIQDTIKYLNLPQKYIGLHIRRGDKITECNYQPLNKYFCIIREYDIKDLYIATDDYGVIKEILSKYPIYKIHTLCTPEKHGYDQAYFNTQQKNIIKQDMLTLFTEIEILNKASLFIGTSESNIGVFMGMRNPTNYKDINNLSWNDGIAKFIKYIIFH